MKFVRLFAVGAAACVVMATPLGAVYVHVRNTGTIKCEVRQHRTKEVGGKTISLNAGEEKELVYVLLPEDSPEHYADVKGSIGTFAGIVVTCGNHGRGCYLYAVSDVASLHYDIKCTPEGITITPEPCSVTLV